MEQHIRDSLRQCWLPTLSDRELSALTEALAMEPGGDARLTQGHTVVPWWSRQWQQGAQAVQACAIGCAVWLSRGPMTAASVEMLWDARQREAEQRGARTGCNSWHFLNWYDSEPWEQVRAALLGECQRELARRELTADEVEELDALEAALPMPPGARIAE